MPTPDDVADKLAEEAIQKELGKQTGKPQARRPDRLAASAAMLDSALTTARIALDTFMSEYAAFKMNGPEATTTQAPTEAAVNRMRDAVRPKTFNAQER